jgi:SOS-response transcriptional repressor LexA
MKRQQAILEFISTHNKNKGYSPTFREIGEAVGLKSSSTVSGHLDRLEKQGLIKRTPSSSRTIEVISKSEEVSEVKVIKRHKNIPSVIHWQGRRYILCPVGQREKKNN